MKNLIIIIAFIMSGVIFTSCDDLVKSCDNGRCMETVEKKYPGTNVYPLPDGKYRFIVVDTCGKILYVRVIGKWDEITSVNVIQNCK